MMLEVYAAPLILLTSICAAVVSATPTMSSSTARLGRASITSIRCRHSNRHRRPAALVAHLAATRASSRPAKYTAIYSSQRILPLERPPDPSSFSSSGGNNGNVNGDDANETSYVQNRARMLRDWMTNKRSIVCVTGAGMSTESGIPDYRGNRGSYFRGHKPIIHHEFMSSERQRRRYWARSLVGYSPFANARPNLGHEALAELEEKGVIGVDLEGCAGFDRLGDGCFGGNSTHINGNDGPRRISIITQNVDTLHSKAGVKHCLHLHGRGDLVRCMNCGLTRDRKDYHDQLMQRNRDWLDEATTVRSKIDGDTNGKRTELRPDGDAELGRVSYDELILPSCPRCGEKHRSRNSAISRKNELEQQSFFKTDVVFFGDSVPRHRFDISYAAIDAADGVLCVGSSLAVHSAFRLVKRAIEGGTPVAILNVGETRVEKEGLGNGLVAKVESPIGETLAEVVKLLNQ